MARACGCDLRAVLAGAIICWAVVEGVAVAQEAAEVTEDLGNSYRLAHRTTAQGSIIETLLFDGQTIVTEIAVPAQDAGMTTGAAVRPSAGGVSPSPAESVPLPRGIGPGFGGTLLTGEVIDDYLVLHRTRASGPVAHEIFRDGRKVGAVTEVGPSSPSVRIPRLTGRNSFTFESTDDRFVVHLTQPDGTRIHATTEHGHFSGQTVERSAGLALPRPGAAVPSEPLPGAAGSPIGRSAEPQRVVRSREPVGRIMVEEPAPQVTPSLPEVVPLPRAFPLRRVRPAAGTTPNPTIAVSVPPSAGPAAVRALHPASAVNAPAAGARPAATSASASPAPNASAARPVGPTNTAQPARPKPAVAVIATDPPAATAAKPVARTSAIAPAAKPKPALATENARLPAVAAKPVAPVIRAPRPPPDTLGQ
jgi:hypothetical protein